MRVSTPILFDLARAVDLDAQLPGERTVEVPPVLLPYVSVPTQLLELQVAAPSDPKRVSFIAARVLIKTNAAQDIQAIATFGQGLWYVEVSLYAVSSFTLITDETKGASVALEDPGGFALDVLGYQPVANVPTYQRRCLHLLLDRDGWVLRLAVRITGAGETVHAKAYIAAAKLL